MKTLLSSIAILFVCVTLSAGNLYTSLLDVNDRWAFEQDFPQEVFQHPEKYNPISQHLLLVHQTLSCRSIEHLSDQQKSSRVFLLNELKKYAEAGKFPNNIFHAQRQPVFIGPNGNYCAVGHLIRQSGRNDLSVKISRNMNYEYLLNMQDEELNHWVQQSGFTAEELAWIQPGYPKVLPLANMKGGTNGSVYTVFPMGNGEIMAGGLFDTAGTSGAGNLAWYYAGFAGFDWQGFGGSGVLGRVYDMVHFNNGIVVAGDFYQADGVSIHSGVAFWDGSQWHNMGNFYIGAMVNTVYDLQVYQGELYAAGFFKSTITPTHFEMIGKWDGSEWVDLGASPDAPVHKLAVYDDKLILAGLFSQIGNTPHKYIAAYDTANGFQPLANGVDAQVFALETVGDTLFAGGELYGTQPQDTFGLAYYYNGNWNRINGFLHTGNQQRVKSLEYTPQGLFVGGDLPYFALIGNVGKNLFRYRFGALEPYGILDSTVEELTYDNGVLYIAGDFVTALTSGGYDTLNHITYLDLYASAVEEHLISPLTVYPQPASSVVHISSESGVKLKFRGMTDISGRQVKVEVVEESGTLRLDLQSLNPGIYLIQLQFGEGIITKRLIVG